MIVLREVSHQFIETPGSNATAAIATPSRGTSQSSIVCQRQQPGGGNPAHFHDREEIMLVLRGSVEVISGDTTTTLESGDSLIIPAKTTHRLATVSATEAEWLLIAPADIGFFRENGERAEPVWAR